MNLCSDGHEEIVHSDRRCPLCDTISEYNEEQDEVLKLKEMFSDLKSEYEELQSDHKELQYRMEGLEK